MVHESQAESRSVLFFGRYGCDYSEQALQHLKLLGFNVLTVLSKKRNEKLPEEMGWWRGDYIFCFRSYFVLPKLLIERATIAAINFHPAPPEYPGSGCLNWALFDGAQQYGVTAHLMEERVDSGAIVECRRFPILKQDTVSSLMSRTHPKALDLFIDITTGLAEGGSAYLEEKVILSQGERWSGNARKMKQIDELQVIDPACSREELERIIRATHTDAFPLEIHLHGYRFQLKS